MVTFSTIVVDMRGHYKSANNDDYCQVIIADEIGEKYHDTMGFTRAFYEKYIKIKNIFESGENILEVFKKKYYYIKVPSIF